MSLPLLPFEVFTSGRQLLPGGVLNGLINMLTGTTSGIIATPGGTQATSIELKSAFNELTTVATAADGVILPAAKSGLRITVLNSGAAAAQVFANGDDTINGTAGNVGVALAAGACALYICVKNGVWQRFVSA